MNILEHIKQELPWFDANSIYDLTRGKPAPEQLDIVQNILCLLYTSDAADEP